MKNKALLAITAGLLFLPMLVGAYYNPGKPTGFVNDYAGVIDSQQKQALETKLVQFEKDTSNEISVVIIPSLKGDTIENFAVKLFEDWAIGKKDNDNGILLLVAIEDRKMRIEVGYGLEGALTDAQSYSIIVNDLQPAFRANDYAGGISKAIDDIILATKGEYTATQNSSKNSSGVNFEWIFFLVFGLPIWLSSVLARSRSWWAGGVIGVVMGIILIFVFSLVVGMIASIILGLLGLLLDYNVSKSYGKAKATGGVMPWWFGGGKSGGFGGGGFGGFGGGSSGGVGSSGGW